MMIITRKGEKVGTVKNGKIITDFQHLSMLADYWERQGGIVFMVAVEQDEVDDSDGTAVVSKTDDNYLKAMSVALGDKGYKTSPSQISITS